MCWLSFKNGMVNLEHIVAITPVENNLFFESIRGGFVRVQFPDTPACLKAQMLIDSAINTTSLDNGEIVHPVKEDDNEPE